MKINPSILWRLFCLFICFGSAGAHAATIELVGTAGTQTLKHDGLTSTITVPIKITTVGDVASLQFDIAYPAATSLQGIDFAAVSIDGALASAGYGVQTNPVVADGSASLKYQRIVITPRNDNETLPSGTSNLATLSFNVTNSGSSGLPIYKIATGTVVEFQNPVFSSREKQQLADITTKSLYIVPPTIFEPPDGGGVPFSVLTDVLLRANGTYSFPSSAHVGENVSIVIEEGVTLRISDVTMGGSVTKPYRFIAKGTASNPIRILPNVGWEGAASGLGILGAGTLVLEHVNFENFETAVQWGFSPIGATIKHCTFKNNAVGLQLYSFSPGTDTVIEDNAFVSNSVAAIEFGGHFPSCCSGSIQPSASNPDLANVVISHNRFQPLIVTDTSGSISSIGVNLLFSTAIAPANIKLNAAFNYWGTTNLQALRYTIFDKGLVPDDPAVADAKPEVIFTPYLDENLTPVTGHFIGGDVNIDLALDKNTEYIVYSDLNVLSGKTFTIAEGAILTFGGAKNGSVSTVYENPKLTSLAGRSVAHIRNFGTVNIKGTASNPVQLYAMPNAYSHVALFADQIESWGTINIEHARINGIGKFLVQRGGDVSIFDSEFDVDGKVVGQQETSGYTINSVRFLRNNVRSLSGTFSTKSSGTLEARANTFIYSSNTLPNDFIDNDCSNVIFSRNNVHLETGQRVLFDGACPLDSRHDARFNWWNNLVPIDDPLWVDFSNPLALPVTPPVADAGPDRSVASTTISLSASASTDPDNNLDHCSWYALDGVTRTLIGNVACSSLLSYTLPTSNIGDVFYFELAAVDTDGFESRDIVHYIFGKPEFVIPFEPTPNAGVDISVGESTLVALDGSASSNTDGAIVQYLWTQLSGPSVVLSTDERSPFATFVSPSVPTSTSLTFQLTVVNASHMSESDTVSVLVSNVNAVPVADAGSNRTVGSSQAVVLDGSRSYDSGGAISSFSWTQTGGTAVSLSGASSANASFTTPNVATATTLSFKLVVTDSAGLSSSDTVQVAVLPGATVTINASPSSVASGANSTLTWSSTNATSCTASDGWSGTQATSGNQTVSPTTTTTYTLACSGAGGTTTQAATVTVTAAPIVTLTANPASIASGSSSTLTWSSTNATSCSATGGWTSSTATSGSQAVSPTATTTYTLSCTGAGGSASQSATVTVSAASYTLTATPTTVAPNGAVNVSWTTPSGTTNSSVDWIGLFAVGALDTSYLAYRYTNAAVAGTAQFAMPSTTGSYEFRYLLNDGYTSVVTSNIVTVATLPLPIITISASPASLAASGSTTLTWSTTNASSCSASGATDWTGAKATSGTQAVSLIALTTYTLTCTGTGGTGNGSVTVSVGTASDTVWVEDALPAGATGVGDADGWTWINSGPTPYSGTLAHKAAGYSGTHQHYFSGASTPLNIGVGDSLFTYVYLDPNDTPAEVMLQFFDGAGWEHRAYWGANSIAWGTDGTVSRKYMGALPATAQWVRLSVPASAVGLEGVSVTGIAYTLYNGFAAWDRSGKSAAVASPTPTVTISASPTSVASGGSSTLTWSSTDATSCTASGGWSGTKAASGTQSVSVSATTTYTLACAGTGGSSTQSTTVTVLPAPIVTLTANPASIASGSSSTLTWSSTNATSCSGSGGWTGTLATSGSLSVSPTATITYTLTCTGTGGSASASAVVTLAPESDYIVTASPTTLVLGSSVHVTWKTPTATNPSLDYVGLFIPGGDYEIPGFYKYTSGAQTGTWDVIPPNSGTFEIRYCLNNAYTCPKIVGPITVTLTGTVPTVTLAASPASIASGSSSTLSWSTTNATSCTASGGWSGTQSTTGSLAVSPTVTTTYTLSCTGTGGSASQLATVTVVPGPTLTFSANPASVPQGTSSSLSWSTTNASSCTASNGWSGTKGMSGLESVIPSTTTSYTLTCTGTGGSVAQTITVTVTAAAPVVTLSASPTSLTSGGSSTLTWSSTNATSCTASNGWTGSKTTSGSQLVSPTTTTTYTLACTGSGGSDSRSVTVTVGGNVNYTVTILPSSQSSNSSKALAISDLGDVVGTDGANALVWINGQLSTVGTADNAYDVNSVGDIVGVEDGWAVRYRNGVRTFLVTQNFSTAKGVNTTGDIVGYSPNGAFLYRNDVLTNLGLFGWSNSQARGVNDAGQIVGTLFGTSSTRAFIWNSGSIQEMPPIAGNYTYATGININGVVVGLTSIALTGSDRHVFVWQNGTMTDLGVSVSDVYANEHYAINDAGTVVGPTFVYQNGTVQASSELMGLLPAAPAGMTWTSLFFEDVNNPGRIVGHAQAINWTTFEIKVVPVLLTPAP